MDEQRRLILDQFTRQAVPFSEMHARDDAEIHRLLIGTAGIGPDDEVLDVACGPGLVACEVAKVARHVTGIDLTPAMIEQAGEAGVARADQPDLGRGRRPAAAFPDASFSRVVTRYSFHHFTDPAGVFAEMVRVCRPGGRVTVCDVFTTSPEQAEAYDRLERTATRPTPTPCNWPSWRRCSPAWDVRREFYRYPVEVEDCCRGRSPSPAGRTHSGGRSRRTSA